LELVLPLSLKALWLFWTQALKVPGCFWTQGLKALGFFWAQVLVRHLATLGQLLLNKIYEGFYRAIREFLQIAPPLFFLLFAHEKNAQ